MDAPSIGRNGDNIQKVGDFLTIVPGAELGKFYCEGGADGTLPKGKCGKNLSSASVAVMNNGADYLGKCPRCGRTLYFNAGWLTVKVIQAQQLKRAGHAPAVGSSFQDVKGVGSTQREEPLPDGRKRIIITPGVAKVVTQALVPETDMRILV